MPRTFNTTGPCDPRFHYMLPPEARLPDLVPFVAERLYFVLHAARQTGKTTAMRAFAARLRAQGVAAVFASLETCQGFTAVEEAEPLWLAALELGAALQLPAQQRPTPHGAVLDQAVGSRLIHWLRAWTEAVAPTPLVLLLDEADVLAGPAMVSLLRQLRAGFPDRPEHFPTSVALIGMRDLRETLTQSKDGRTVNPGSPFNIKAASLTLRNFTQEEVADLYGQHTADTGQVFLDEAAARAFYWTQGQPFLVNALARIAVRELVPDRAAPITAAHVDEAKERLVVARTTHLDSLAERLKDPRVARIVEAVLVGDEPRAIPYDHDDFKLTVDLGLIRKGLDGAEPANPIYREVLARQISYNLQESLGRLWWRWQRPDGRLDFPALIDAFLDWWRENADALVEDIPQYPEAVPHISFMGFLQRVVNGGGRVTREYAAGRRALDLLVEYGPDRFAVEIKRVRPRDSLDRIRAAAIQQSTDYLRLTGLNEGWILIFNQHPGLSWDQRLWSETVTQDGRTLHLRGA